MDMLQVGNDVVIKVKHVLWDSRHLYATGVAGPEFEYYSGTVTTQKYTNPDEIAITTDDPRVAFRRIHRSRIVEVNNTKIEYVATKSVQKTITVQGSKGNSYTVTNENGKVSCTCPGFSFRKSCRHLAEVM
jgi:hypothetical protein